jgi:hypothetical protein
MRALQTIAYASLYACVACISLLSACGGPTDGYYDANGKFVPYNTSNHNYVHAPDPAAANYYDDDHYYDEYHHPVHTATYVYDRPGYYDYNGYYIAEESGMDVPHGMFPPRGMCRVWFPHRPPADQPRIESCDGIRERVPVGAYVIYGG